MKKREPASNKKSFKENSITPAPRGTGFSRLETPIAGGLSVSCRVFYTTNGVPSSNLQFKSFFLSSL